MSSSLRSRIQGGTLIVLAPVLLVGLFAVPRVLQLGSALRAIIQANYISIQCAQHMQFVLHGLQKAELEGDSTRALPGLRNEFSHWMTIENQSLTEIGEPETAKDIDTSANHLFDDIAAARPGTRHDRQFDHLFSETNRLIKLNQNAIWRNDSRARQLSQQVIFTLVTSLLVAIALGIALSWAISNAIARPLSEVATQLREVGESNLPVRLGHQRLRELEYVAHSFNQMADRLEYYQRLNIDRLLFEKSKIEAIIQRLDDGITLIDTAGKVAHLNEVAALVLGVDPADSIGKPFEGLPSDAASYLQIREDLRRFKQDQGRERHGEITLHVRGRDRSFMVHPIRLDEGKYAIGTLLVLQDVTYVREQDRARNNLIATLSHELRTPLTSLGLAAQILERKASTNTDDERKLLATIVSEFSRMSDLIDDLLDVSRQPHPSLGLRWARFDLVQMVKELGRRFVTQATEKGVALNVRADVLPQIYADREKISWALSNLIVNALRHTPQHGSVEIVARSVDPALVRLEVSDTGPGIPPEMREQIFERFSQYAADGQRTGAAGLGLAIAKEIVDAHGGRISVESNLGHGSRFLVDLPISPPSPAPH